MQWKMNSTLVFGSDSGGGGTKAASSVLHFNFTPRYSGGVVNSAMQHHQQQQTKQNQKAPWRQCRNETNIDGH